MPELLGGRCDVYMGSSISVSSFHCPQNVYKDVWVVYPSIWHHQMRYGYYIQRV